jgi:hypothetical protein
MIAGARAWHNEAVGEGRTFGGYDRTIILT